MACAAAPRDTGISLKCTCCSLKRRRLGRRIDLATVLEERLPVELGRPAEVITHLESLEDHEHVHSTGHVTDRTE